MGRRPSNPSLLAASSVGADEAVLAELLENALRHSGSLVQQQVRMRALKTPDSLEEACRTVPAPDSFMPGFDAKVDPDNLLFMMPSSALRPTRVSLQRISFMGTEWLALRLLGGSRERCLRFCLLAAALKNIGRNTSRSVVVEVCDREDDMIGLACAPLGNDKKRAGCSACWLEHAVELAELAEILLAEACTAQKQLAKLLKQWVKNSAAPAAVMSPRGLRMSRTSTSESLGSGGLMHASKTDSFVDLIRDGTREASSLARLLHGVKALPSPAFVKRSLRAFTRDAPREEELEASDMSPASCSSCSSPKSPGRSPRGRRGRWTSYSSEGGEEEDSSPKVPQLKRRLSDPGVGAGSLASFMELRRAAEAPASLGNPVHKSKTSSASNCDKMKLKRRKSRDLSHSLTVMPIVLESRAEEQSSSSSDSEEEGAPSETVLEARRMAELLGKARTSLKNSGADGSGASGEEAAAALQLPPWLLAARAAAADEHGHL